jgi:hypothetical protein
MVAIGPELSLPAAETTIEAVRSANQETSKPRRQRSSSSCLDDEVEMIGLNRIVDDAKVSIPGALHRCAHGRSRELVSQRTAVAACAHRDVDRMRGRMRGTTLVRDETSPGLARFSTCAHPKTAPAASFRRQTQFELLTARRSSS